MAVEAAQPSKLRWGDLEEDDGEDLDFLLPPKQVITTTRICKLANARLSKRAVERRSWAKFGDAVHDDVGARLTMVSTEEILLERPRAPGTKQEETKVVGDPLSQIGRKGGAVRLCRTCGKDHWTSRCPYKDLAKPSDKPAYVPPGRTGRNEENSIRITNLSEDTREPDLLELFRPFGSVSRVYIVIDQKTGMSRGFGFVNFVNREDAERAINKLNGYGYDNLILRVEWAASRSN